MKNYILFAIVFISALATAQERQVLRTYPQSQAQLTSYDSQNGDYIMDTTNNLNIYEGTWIYNDNLGTIFTLKLRRKDRVLLDTGNTYNFADMIISTYKLIKNNILLFDNLNHALPSEIAEDDGDFGYLSNVSSFSDLDGGFEDVTYNIFANCEIKKLVTPAGQPEKISFRISGAIRRNPQSFYLGLPSTFSVPTNIVLTKI
ncbi:DUF6705 family protein [uncultured Flavobacterium sp.]|uniref:DUF6705 family protein n=1 Tax=uncultured Flavobacterium sp. TaxID=165435 RepID=UPI0025EEB6FF|nr:DUF6705 family protein [uncultured Flavobacterium sp.]